MANDSHYDVIVIGAGPAGRTAALRCAHHGLKVACIDDHPAPGGACLHGGSISASAMIRAASLMTGVPDPAALHAHRRQVIAKIGADIAARLSKAGVALLHGHASLRAGMTVAFLPAGRKRTRTLHAGQVVLAPGARPMGLPGIAVDGERILDPSQALLLAEPPARLCIAGAGVIGLEIASLWRSMGSRVTLLDARERLLPMADETIVEEAARCFAARGLDIRLNARVTAARQERRGVTVEYERDGKDCTEHCDVLVVSAGRQPATEGLAAPEADLLFDERGEIHVNDDCRTNLPGVYAVGDAVHGPMLAHKGIEEAIHVAEIIAGRTPQPLRLDHLPATLHTQPEIAWAGLTEAQARAAGTPCRTGTSQYFSLEPGAAEEPWNGLAKLVVHAETDRLLGVHVIGRNAGEIVSAALVALELGASGEDLAGMPFPYPSVTSALRKAALAIA